MFIQEQCRLQSYLLHSDHSSNPRLPESIKQITSGMSCSLESVSKSLIIENLLLGLPVPSSMLYEKYNVYYPLGSVNTVLAVKEFLDSQFSLCKLYFLTELNSLNFSELDTQSKQCLLMTYIPYIVVLPLLELNKKDLNHLTLERCW